MYISSDISSFEFAKKGSTFELWYNMKMYE